MRRFGMGLGLGMVGMTLACSGEPAPVVTPERFADCADAACREAWVRGRAESDSRAVAEAISGVDDPVEQVLLVRASHEAHPPSLLKVCRKLEGAPAERDCERLRDRAHLSVEAVPEQAPPDDATPRRGMILDLVRVEPLPTGRLSTEVVDSCAEEALADRCRAEAAVTEAAAGRSEGAWARCLAIEPGQARQECAFRSAETLLADSPGRRATVEDVVPALELCLEADAFQGQCITHLVQAMGQWAPSGPGSSEDDWARVEAGRAAGAAFLESLRSGLGEPWSERLLSEAAWNTVVRQDPLQSVPLEGLPEGAEAHLRGAAAVAMLQDRRPGSLLELSEQLGSLMAEGGEPLVDTGRPPGPRRLEPQTDYWHADHESEAAFPSVPLAGRVRRTRHEDPALDRLIVLMEAAAQASPPMLGVIEGGVDHQDDRVRWTAVRLLRCLSPDLDLAAYLEDPHPAVRHRASEDCVVGGPGFMPKAGGEGPRPARGPRGGPPGGGRGGPGVRSGGPPPGGGR